MKKHAFQLQLAKEAILLEKYTEAVLLLQPLSANGVRDAQFLYAYLHFWDDQLSRIGAVNLMTAVARWGHPEANYILAVCPDLLPAYNFTLPETEKQFEYLQKACDAGSDFAAADLADCYLEGNQVEANPEIARKLLELNFERGRRNRLLSKASYLLAHRELLGIDGETNIDEGILKIRVSVYATDGLYASKAIELLRSQVTHYPNKGLETLIQELEEYLANQKHIPHWQQFIHHYCMHSLEYDLRDITLNTFMDFVFDHYPRLQHDREAFRWEKHAEVFFNPSELVHMYTEMFKNAGLIAERYNIDQIEQGFGMLGIRGWANWTIGCVLTDVSSAMEDAEDCIHAMYELFAQLFLKPYYTDIGYMWWDIGYGVCENPTAKRPERTKEDKQRLFQASFDTIVKVLKMPQLSCQEAAIHGLGHSRHPDKERVLQEYLRDNPDLPCRLSDYALAAIRGEVM